ncbi:MAG: hypothetical protein DPW18_12045 [Chloroflexi bacterium]|nr:hypothetical protein [Chloroflexota bacterium]
MTSPLPMGEGRVRALGGEPRKSIGRWQLELYTLQGGFATRRFHHSKDSHNASVAVLGGGDAAESKQGGFTSAQIKKEDSHLQW